MRRNASPRGSTSSNTQWSSYWGSPLDGLCEGSKFPKSFGYVTRHHHNPSELPEAHRMLTSIVYVADRLSGQLDYGFRTDLVHLEISSADLDARSLTAEQLERVKSSLPQAFEDIEATFG